MKIELIHRDLSSLDLGSKQGRGKWKETSRPSLEFLVLRGVSHCSSTEKVFGNDKQAMQVLGSNLQEILEQVPLLHLPLQIRECLSQRTLMKESYRFFLELDPVQVRGENLLREGDEEVVKKLRGSPRTGDASSAPRQRRSAGA